MSDEVYSSFLDQANQDTGATRGSASNSSRQISAKAADAEVPAILQKVDKYYVSESDEPFEPVSLKWNGKKMPSEQEFGKLVGHEGEVSTIDEEEFDPHGHYRDILQVVETAGDGKTRIFRVQHGRTRTEYYVVGLDGKEEKLVGLKAMAVES